jgi:apolipoprotein N-acyltransferase
MRYDKSGTILSTPKASVALGILGAAIYALSIWSASFSSLAFIATAPWALLLLVGHERIGYKITVFLLSVYVMVLLCLPWLRSFNFMAWVIAPLFYAPLFMFIPIFGLALKSAWPRVPLSLAWSIAFTGGEYLRIRLSAGEIAFCQLGSSLAGFSDLVQVVDVAGVAALSFLASLCSGLIAEIVLALGIGWPAFRLPRRLIAEIVATSALFVAALFYGQSRHSHATLSPGPRILVVQPNYKGWSLSAAEAEQRLENVIAFTTRVVSKLGRVQLIVWPENSVLPVPPYDNEGRGARQTQRILQVARATGAIVISDGPTITANGQHHTVTVVYPDSNIRSYHKHLLVPWSEYVPYTEFLRRVNPTYADSFTNFVHRYSPNLASFDPGSNLTTFPAGDASWFASPICYETLSAQAMRTWCATFNTTRQGPYFFVNPVNEKLLGPEVHRATLNICKLRAIESRTTIIRAANNGISAAIDPNGDIYAVAQGVRGGTATNEPAAFVTNVLFERRGVPLYVRLGDWLPLLCIALSALAAGWRTTQACMAAMRRSWDKLRLTG